MKFRRAYLVIDWWQKIRWKKFPSELHDLHLLIQHKDAMIRQQHRAMRVLHMTPPAIRTQSIRFASQCSIQSIRCGSIYKGRRSWSILIEFEFSEISERWIDSNWTLCRRHCTTTMCIRLPFVRKSHRFHTHICIYILVAELLSCWYY